MSVEQCRRWGGRVAFVLAAAAGLLALFSPVPAAQVAGAPAVYRGEASAQGVVVYPDRAAGLAAIPQVIRGVFLEGVSSMSSSGGNTAVATLFNPGGISGLNSLICGEFDNQFPPEFAPLFAGCVGVKYPFVAAADETTPQDKTVGAIAVGQRGDPLRMNAGSAEAYARGFETGTDAVVHDVFAGVATIPPGLVLPLPGMNLTDPAIASVDTVAVRTRQFLDGADFVVEATSHTSGISVLGGFIKIEAVDSSSVSRARGDVATTTPVTTVSGVTVGGVPVSVDSNGFTFGDPNAPTGPVFQSLGQTVSEAAAALGLSMRTLENTSTDAVGRTEGQTGGLAIRFNADLSAVEEIGDQYFVELLLGSAGTRAFASEVPAAGRPGGGSPGSFGGSGTGSGSFGSGSGSGAGASSGTGGVSGSGAAAGGAGPTGQAAAPATIGGRLIDNLFDDRVRLVYLALCLTVLGVCIAPGITNLPARLPGKER